MRPDGAIRLELGRFVWRSKGFIVTWEPPGAWADQAHFVPTLPLPPVEELATDGPPIVWQPPPLAPDWDADGAPARPWVDARWYSIRPDEPRRLVVVADRGADVRAIADEAASWGVEALAIGNRDLSELATVGARQAFGGRLAARATGASRAVLVWLAGRWAYRAGRAPTAFASGVGQILAAAREPFAAVAWLAPYRTPPAWGAAVAAWASSRTWCAAVDMTTASDAGIVSAARAAIAEKRAT